MHGPPEPAGVASTLGPSAAGAPAPGTQPGEVGECCSRALLRALIHTRTEQARVRPLADGAGMTLLGPLELIWTPECKSWGGGHSRAPRGWRPQAGIGGGKG